MNRLFFAVIVAAGCAGASPAQTDVPTPAGTSGTDGGRPPSTDDAGPLASATPTSPVAPGPMKPPTPTIYAAELQAIGLDPQHLPPLNKIAPEQLRKVMPLVAKSLGVKCNACHNFNADTPAAQRTPRMNVASHMWNDFVRTRTIDGDQPVFCDSCHHGSLTFLDRHDRPALEHWMDESFVKTLGAEKCETCHGTPPRWKFIDVWRR